MIEEFYHVEESDRTPRDHSEMVLDYACRGCSLMFVRTVARYTGFMNQLLQVFIQICLFQKGPQDLPASPFLLKLTAVAYVLSGSILLSSELGGLQAVIQAAAETAFMFGFVFILLRIFQKSARLEQTATGVFGSGCLMTLLTLPVLWWAQARQAAELTMTGANFMLLAMLIWSFIILGHILKEALERSVFTGMALSLSYMVLSYQVIRFLFPVS